MGPIEDYSRAIEIDPRFAVAYANRGEARKMKGDLAGAIADFVKALEVAPASWRYRSQTEELLEQARKEMDSPSPRAGNPVHRESAPRATEDIEVPVAPESSAPDPEPDRPRPTRDWLADRGAVLDRLNGDGSGALPREIVGLIRHEGGLLLFSRVDPDAIGGWRCTVSSTVDEVFRFLSGRDPRRDAPVARARVVVGPDDSILIFHRGDASRSRWSWKRATSVDDLWNYLRGSGAYRGARWVTILQRKRAIPDYIAFSSSTPDGPEWRRERIDSLDRIVPLLEASRARFAEIVAEPEGGWTLFHHGSSR